MDKEKRHFIKNKLQVIQTSLEIIKDQDQEKDNDEIKELISIMMYCVEEINRVI